VSKVGKELFFQGRTMPYEHLVVLLTMRKRKRHMTSAWMVKNYIETFKNTPFLLARD